MTTEGLHIRDLLDAATATLDGSSDSPRLDAEVLLACSMGRDRSWLYAHPEATPGDTQLHCFGELVARRRDGEPVAHLTGRREFWSLPIAVTADTLVPRPETELLVAWALELLRGQARPRVLDLGTGSGAVALALASERPDVRLTATESNPATLDVARRNGAALALGGIDWRVGDWFDALPEGVSFELVVTNPPYVATGDVHLARGDLRHEPRAALVSGADGLDDIRRIVARAPRYLAERGWLLLEHGWNQGAAARALLDANGFGEIDTRRDHGGRERASGGRILP